MEIILSFLSIFVFYFIFSCFINSGNNADDEDSDTLYANFNNDEIKKEYQEDEYFRVKLLKVKNPKSESAHVYLIIGFKKIPEEFTRLQINQIDKDNNVITFKEVYVPTEELRYNEYENKTLFSEYDPNTIPKFYTTTMDFYLDDLNITEYFNYKIQEPKRIKR